MLANALQLSYLDDHGILEEGYDITNWPEDSKDAREGFSDELIALVATLLLDNTEFERLRKKQKLPKTEKLTPEIAKVLLEVVKRRATEYPTTAEGDERILAELPQTDQDRSLRRKAMAVQVRLGEKKVLRKAEELLGEYLRSSQGSEAVVKAGEKDDGRPNKKRKTG